MEKHVCKASIERHTPRTFFGDLTLDYKKVSEFLLDTENRWSPPTDVEVSSRWGQVDEYTYTPSCPRSHADVNRSPMSADLQVSPDYGRIAHRSDTAGSGHGLPASQRCRAVRSTSRTYPESAGTRLAGGRTRCPSRASRRVP